MSEFGDRPFVAGSLIGVRAFDADKLGRLVGVNYPQIFTPGENTAKCFGGGLTFFVHVMSETLGRRPGEERPKSPPQHVTAGVGCSCGFYAYYDGHSDYSERGRVTALIEGFGVCSVGTRGFRAEKARLVALVDDRRASRRHPRWFDRLADRCRRRIWPQVLAVFAAIVGVLAVIAGVLAGIDGALVGLPLVPGGGALVASAVVVLKADFHGIDRAHPSVCDLSRCHDQRARGGSMDDVLANYPEVPVYRSLAAAIKAHPLTVPEPPAKPTPADPDFWTRSAS